MVTDKQMITDKEMLAAIEDPHGLLELSGMDEAWMKVITDANKLNDKK